MCKNKKKTTKDKLRSGTILDLNLKKAYKK